MSRREFDATTELGLPPGCTWEALALEQSDTRLVIERAPARPDPDVRLLRDLVVIVFSLAVIVASLAHLVSAETVRSVSLGSATQVMPAPAIDGTQAPCRKVENG